MAATCSGAALAAAQKRAAPAPEPAKALQFDRGLFARWLRLLLCSFYGTEERVVADLLRRREALLRDTVIAEVLGLHERQVRQALERRLVPDCLVERRTEGEGQSSKTFYRISPTALAATALRLQLLEDKLSSITEEKYRCPKCGTVYDSLQAMSLAGQHVVGNDGRSAFAFLCAGCEGEDGGGTALVAAGDSRAAQRGRLQRFRQQCGDLLLMTRQIKDMQVPLFSAEEKDPKKELHGAAAAGRHQPSPEQPAAPAPPPAAARSPGGGCRAPVACRDNGAGSPAGGSRPGAARLDAWLCREVLQQQAPLAEGGPAGGGAAAAGCAGEALEEELQEALLRAQGDALPPGAALGAPAPSAGAAPPPGRCAELTVLVQGRPHPLDQALDSDELQEQMTDAEYQSFVDLAREETRRAREERRRAAAAARRAAP